MAESESQLQVRVARYLTENYPNVLFHSDFGSGIKMTKGQAVKQKRQNGGRRGWPDMFIAEPRVFMDEDSVFGGPDREYYGLFLELKKEGTRIIKKDGSWASPHIAEQAEVMRKLRVRGYETSFAAGFDNAKKLIDIYLNGEEIYGNN